MASNEDTNPILPRMPFLFCVCWTPKPWLSSAGHSQRLTVVPRPQVPMLTGIPMPQGYPGHRSTEAIAVPWSQRYLDHKGTQARGVPGLPAWLLSLHLGCPGQSTLVSKLLGVQVSTIGCTVSHLLRCCVVVPAQRFLSTRFYSVYTAPALLWAWEASTWLVRFQESGGGRSHLKLSATYSLIITPIYPIYNQTVPYHLIKTPSSTSSASHQERHMRSSWQRKTEMFQGNTFPLSHQDRSIWKVSHRNVPSEFRVDVGNLWYTSWERNFAVHPKEDSWMSEIYYCTS